jgi:hypothetical protein
VLPKYLLLACVSGAASYAGIQLLNSRFHVQLLPAKLLVETLLFFANFAIQRDFIFGKVPEGPAATRRWIDRVPSWIPRAVLAASPWCCWGLSGTASAPSRCWGIRVGRRLAAIA